MIDWCNFRNGEIAVNCRTEKEAREFVEECYTHNIANDRNDTAWTLYKENTCYVVSDNRLYFTSIHDGDFCDLEIVRYREDTDKMESNTDKVELKEGMIIECRNGDRYLLIRMANDVLIGCQNDEWLGLSYDDNLLENMYYDRQYDIMKIYKTNAHILIDLFKDDCLTCIWERKEPKKMTLAEISEALGYEVELV